MKHLLLFLWCGLLAGAIHAQSGVAINTDGSAPHPSALLDIKSSSKGMLPPRMSYAQRTAIASPAQGLMVYQTDPAITPQGLYVYDGTAWKLIAKAEDVSGGGAWTLSPYGLYTNTPNNVGIGNSNPAYMLDVNGSIHSTYTGFFDGNLGVGPGGVTHRLQVNNGDIGIVNSSDGKVWTLGYSSANHLFHLAENGTDRLAVANGGNVGIGTSTPTALLDVNGSARVAGDLTVDNGKGILRSSNSTQQKYHTFTAAFTVGLAAFGTSEEGSINWPSNIFTKPPKVMVGDITYTGGNVGELWRLQLVIYNTTATGCKCRLINTSNGPVNYSVTWNIILIGE